MKTSIILITAALLFISLSIVFAQKQGQEKIDSLLKELPKAKEDTNKVNILNNISISYMSIGPDKGIKFGKQAFDLATKFNFKKGQAKALNSIGVNYHSKMDIDKALEYLIKSLILSKEIGFKQLMAYTLGNIGLVYRSKTDNDKAIENFLKALKISEELNDKKGIAFNYYNIGGIYLNQGINDKAYKNFFEAMKAYEEIGDKSRIAYSHIGIGLVFLNKFDYDNALEHFQITLKINEEIGDKILAASTLSNIGEIYKSQKKYYKSIEYIHNAINVSNEIGDKMHIAYCYNTLSQIYSLLAHEEDSINKKKNIRKINSYYQKSLENAFKAEKMAEDNQFHMILYQIYETISSAYEKLGNSTKALEYYKKYTLEKDSIYSKEKTEKTMELMAEHDADMRERDIRDLEKEKNIQETRTYYLSAVSGLALLAIIIGFFFYRNKRRTNRWLSAKNKVIKDANIELDALNNDLADKNQQIVQANIELDTLNNDLATKNYEISEAHEKITSSIAYASKIQTAMLPFATRMKEILNDYFILFLPKDIVSGDFYWIEKTGWEDNCCCC
jgi:tetratricopeptide (TPR) repeat protein